MISKHARYGLDFQRKSDMNKTPIHSAIERCDLDCVIYLLSYGANFSSLDSLNNTPLHYAVKHNSILIVKILLCFGADPTFKNKNGLSPIDISTS